ncbi:MAG TPA: riboflavin synthase [Solirubrobacterales bacterium]|nr:riboflavin synthase [Solirubrobacterales bacterium]
MFTGIVKELGTVDSVERSGDGARIVLAASFASELSEGDSVAVNGVCLTATELDDGSFSADVMNQSLNLTALGTLEDGARVNLEPALRAGDPLGGHIVQGHVDCVGAVSEITPDGFARRIRIDVPGDLRRYLVEHGSVTVDGVSLTVASLTDAGFEVSLIPETLERTTLGSNQPGDKVNLEFDVIARYVERLLGFKEEGNDS